MILLGLYQDPFFERTVFSSIEPAEDLNDITIQLSPNVLTQKRTYVRLIDVLGDVGGLMEIVNMIFSVIASLIVNILYEKSLVNNLFDFYLDKKLVVLKNKKIYIIISENNEGENKDNSQNNKDNKNLVLNINIDQNNISDDKSNNKKEDIPSKNNTLNQDIVVKKRTKISNKNLKYNDSQKKILIHPVKSNTSSKRNINEDENKSNYINKLNSIDEKKDIKDNSKYESEEDYLPGKNIINKIKVNKFFIHCGFCCVRSISNLNNTLLDEGMKLIAEQLDVFNIFRKLYIEARRERKIKEKSIRMEMSDECIKNIEEQLNKINYKSEPI